MMPTVGRACSLTVRATSSGQEGAPDVLGKRRRDGLTEIEQGRHPIDLHGVRCFLARCLSSTLAVRRDVRPIEHLTVTPATYATRVTGRLRETDHAATAHRARR